jgi:hypothetical protein
LLLQLLGQQQVQAQWLQVQWLQVQLVLAQIFPFLASSLH